MNIKRQNAYIELIEDLVNSDTGTALEILKDHQHLIDAGLIEMMKEVAVLLRNKGLSDKSEFLIDIIKKLSEELELPGNISSALPEEYLIFLGKALKIIRENKASREKQYLLLQENTDKLNYFLAQILSSWTAAMVGNIEKDSAEDLGILIFKFSKLVQQFPRGKKSNNLEVAIAGYKAIVDSIFTREVDSERWAAVQRNLGISYLYRIREEPRDNIEEAICYFNKALDVNTLEEYPEEWAEIQICLGEAYRQRIKGKKADNLEKAIEYNQEAEKKFTRKLFPLQWANIQNNLGGTYIQRIEEDKKENIEKSIEYCNAALEVFTPEKNEFEWSTAKNNLGEAYFYRIEGERGKNVEEAIGCYQDALKIRTSQCYPYQWVITQNNLAKAYLERIEGDQEQNIEQAISLFDEILKVSTVKEFPLKWIEIKNHLGVAYLYRPREERAKNIKEAIKHFSEALEICGGRSEIHRADLLKNLGVAYFYLGQKDQSKNIEESENTGDSESIKIAINCYEEALKFYTHDQNEYQWATLQANLSSAYCMVAGLEEKAIEKYTDVLKICTRDRYPYQWATIKNNLGNAYRYSQKIPEAIDCYRQALKIHVPKVFPLECQRAGQNLGKTGFENRDWETAIEGYGLAIAAIEYSRNLAITDRRRQEIISDAIDVYGKMIQACIHSGDFNKAFEYVERSKARNLVDLLANREIYPKNCPETVVNELKRLRREIVAEQHRLDVVTQNSSYGMMNSDAWLQEREKLNQLLQQRENLITQKITPQDPSFRNALEVQSISFNEIIGKNGTESLIDDHTVILEWYITNERFYTFIISRQFESPKIWSSPQEKSNLEELHNWFNQDYLQIYQKNKETRIEKIPELLARLTKILHLNEVLELIPPECEQLILIPHRLLHLIPLHALPRSPYCYLLDYFPKGISYAPSCQMLQIAKKQQRPNFYRLFAIGNPTKDLNYATIAVQGIRDYFQHFQILEEENAKKSEIVEIKKKDKGEREVIQNPQLSLVNCLHFSCHGKFNFNLPLESYLELTDESLKLIEIFDLDLPQCRLVTLSACQTGLTDNKIPSDEYIGLPSGFLFAGSPCVVSSLWNVNQVSTALLTIKFYQNLDEGNSVAVALNQAQIWLRNATKDTIEKWKNELKIDSKLDDVHKRKMRRFINNIKADSPFSSPYYWAGFCAIGQ